MKISARKRGKCPYLPVCLACSSGGWWCIIQEILFHLEFSHTIQAINTAFIFFIKDKFETQRPATLQEKPFWLNIKYKNQFLDALSDTSLHTCLRSWRRAVVWALHTYKLYSQCCTVQLIQPSEETEQKRVHWLIQYCTFSNWQKGEEIPHTQSGHVIHWKLLVPLVTCPAETIKLFQWAQASFLLQESIKNEKIL